jgi:hypothetical protein
VLIASFSSPFSTQFPPSRARTAKRRNGLPVRLFLKLHRKLRTERRSGPLGAICREWLAQAIGASAPKPRELLTLIYGWSTEGFDTPDLKKAKALLEELSR